MTAATDRRRFLQTSLSAGAILSLAGTDLGRREALQAGPSLDADANPRVRPGLVNWHADFAAACRSARTSRKPVLHFQMMGKLDERLC